jgi:2-methylisocitrate lyase-like PEP mutase family enzyme
MPDIDRGFAERWDAASARVFKAAVDIPVAADVKAGCGEAPEEVARTECLQIAVEAAAVVRALEIPAVK